ncbi:MAG: hypothetical protein EXR62_01890 [Chloroflexi bacterium]|nr:hypothetical protein [Chloroflexota bacterium]
MKTPMPRGQRRLIYVSDPSSIASRVLPDPTAEKDLRRWVNDVADSETDTLIQEVYTQAWTVYWRCEKFDYDARPQHRRFLPLLDAGVQPLAVLIEESHRRGMEFIAGFRINDNHAHVSIKQGVGAGGSFIVNNPQWAVAEEPPGDFYKLSSPLDFSFPEVREFILSVMTEVVQRFDVDGIEMCFRDHYYFPVDKGRERQPLLTDMVTKIRAMLDAEGRRKGKRLQLGARVFSTLEECQDLGLDVPTWIRTELLDYVCPSDVMYADFNAPYNEFAALTRVSNCMLYPAIMPWSSWRARKRMGHAPMTQDNRRALAQNFYGAGADGVSIYNHFEVLRFGAISPPFYPLALHDFHELRHPERILQGKRHYIFDPTWGGFVGFGQDKASTGVVKANKIVLRRADPQPQGEYVFRIYEDLNQARGAILLLRGFNMTPADQIALSVNGAVIPPEAISCRDDEMRIDLRGQPDRPSYTANIQAGGVPTPSLVPPGSPDPPFTTCWFALTAPPAVYGENRLDVQLLRSDPAAQEDIVIDEIEVFVVPRP